MMFERFTERARLVMKRAKDEAARLGKARPRPSIYCWV
jgi:hypothetical protein